MKKHNLWRYILIAVAAFVSILGIAAKASAGDYGHPPTTTEPEYTTTVPVTTEPVVTTVPETTPATTAPVTEAPTTTTVPTTDAPTTSASPTTVPETTPATDVTTTSVAVAPPPTRGPTVTDAPPNHEGMLPVTGSHTKLLGVLASLLVFVGVLLVARVPTSDRIRIKK